MKQSAIILLLLAVVFLGEGSAAAQSQGGAAQITVSAQAGYGDTGTYLIGEWLPVRVTLTNPAGGGTLRVRVQVESKGADDNIVTGLYARDVDLPAPSRKEITLYTYSGSYTRRFRVQVLQGSTTIAAADADAEPYEPPANMIVGVASSDPALLNILKGEQLGHIVNSLPPGGYKSYPNPYTPYGQYTANGLATVAHIKLDTLPVLSEALESLGALVLDDVDTGSLSVEQREALEAWIARGGSLVVMVRAGGAANLGGIANLLPVTLGGSRSVASLAALSDFVKTPLAVSGPVQIGDAAIKQETVSTSRVLAQQDGIPLVAVRDLGLGYVIYLGVSPAVAPLKNWDGTVPLMKRLLAEHPLRLSYGAFLRFAPSRGYYMGSLFDTYGGMFALPGLQLPDPWLIGLFLLLYIIIIGPVNFIVLRRIRRTELAWVTVPVLVLVFSVGAYLLAFQSKGGELVAIRANVVSTYPGVEQASFAQHFGLFSPIRRTYKFSLGADSVVTEMNSYGYYQAGSDMPAPVVGGNPTTINNVNINTWSLKGFVAEHSSKAESPVETKLVLGDNMILGTLRNLTTVPLQDVALIRGDEVRYVGYLAPGQQIDVRLPISSGRFNNSSPVDLLPPPNGVTPPNSGQYYPYNGGQGNTAEQRTYYRKIELLSAALYPLVADEPPSDMSVIVLAWGSDLPVNFDVDGHTTNSEDINLWAHLAPVSGSGNEPPSLTSGLIPYSIYAPGNVPTLVIWNGSRTLPNSPGNPPLPTVPAPITPGITPGITSSVITNVPVPTPSLPNPAYTPPPQGIQIAPYADVQYRLPAGTRPTDLTLSYSIAQISADADIDVLAYNITTGKWDRLATWQPTNQKFDGALALPTPSQYTGPAGDLTIRFQPEGADATLTDASLNMALNEP